MSKIAAFIDGANLYAASKSLGLELDYVKILDLLRKRGELVRAYYYTAMLDAEDGGFSPLKPLVDWLAYNGFTVVTKPAKEFITEDGRRKIKGNMDIEIAVDMIGMSDHVDHIVLFSGDGDFRYLVEALQRRGVRVTVVSTIRSKPPMAADDLRRQADEFVDMSDIAHLIQKTVQKGETK